MSDESGMKPIGTLNGQAFPPTFKGACLEPPGALAPSGPHCSCSDVHCVPSHMWPPRAGEQVREVKPHPSSASESPGTSNSGHLLLPLFCVLYVFYNRDTLTWLYSFIFTTSLLVTVVRIFLHTRKEMFSDSFKVTSLVRR